MYKLFTIEYKNLMKKNKVRNKMQLRNFRLISNCEKKEKNIIINKKLREVKGKNRY